VNVLIVGRRKMNEGVLRGITEGLQEEIRKKEILMIFQKNTKMNTRNMIITVLLPEDPNL